MARILTYGASTTFGYHDTEHGGWSARLKISMQNRVLAKQPPYPDVINLGAPERPLRDILKTLPSDTKYYRRGRLLSIFMVGLSESRITPGNTEPIVPLPSFQKQLTKLSRLCVKNSVLPIFVGIPPIDDERTHPFLSGERDCGTFDTTLRKQYESVVRDHALSVGAPFVEVWDALGGADAVSMGTLAEDEGLHPSAYGHHLIHQAVEPVVLDCLARTDPAHAEVTVLPEVLRNRTPLAPLAPLIPTA